MLACLHGDRCGGHCHHCAGQGHVLGGEDAHSLLPLSLRQAGPARRAGDDERGLWARPHHLQVGRQAGSRADMCSLWPALAPWLQPPPAPNVLLLRDPPPWLSRSMATPEEFDYGYHQGIYKDPKKYKASEVRQLFH